ncbi:MAG: mitochondrial aspartate-glutamate transporter agc1 [Trizodia sp. TS-e1964]|nr:MAG: mitochondrial aspartate-glutamate transporter agc1 [Trizodia sp. TS-e1964]
MPDPESPVKMNEPQLSADAKATFDKYSIKDEASGTQVMLVDGFVNAIAPEGANYHKIKREQFAILFSIADTTHTGKLSIQDWANFENLLSKADADYEIAFRIFDTEGSGTIKFDQFQKLYNLNKGSDTIPFDWNSEWTTLYLGGKKNRHDMTYPQFTQMLRGLQGERVRQAFHHLDKNGDGYIEPRDFQRIILETAQHKLSDHLLENLQTLCNISAGGKVSYANVRAFQNVIREMDLVELIIRKAASKSKDGRITRSEFLDEAARNTRFSMFTPMEADILFHFAGLDETSGRLSVGDFAKVLDASWHAPYPPGESSMESEIEDSGKTVLRNVLESAHHFALGSLAGAFGAFMVYPIDLVKTRMQNQRSQQVGQMLYKNSLDCAKKVIRNEGFKGLYSGVVPQLIGVAPEKAIKLTVNDLARRHFSDPKSGAIALHHEMFSGGLAGACQVIFTNPLEIVKIRLQVQGEIAKTVDGVPPRSAIWIVKNLGLVGLYKGASACLLRDVPFSAIYFTSYNHLKRDYFGESQTNKLGVLQLLTAGAMAGMPAAYLTTPCDVIKTRLQVEARKGETKYHNLRHCASTIFKEEGMKAFFKGGPARILRSSPQFGFTLAAYEVLQNLLPLPGSAFAPATETENLTPLRDTIAPLPYLRSRNALKLILDLDQNFGKLNVPNHQGWMGIPGYGGKPSGSSPVAP